MEQSVAEQEVPFEEVAEEEVPENSEPPAEDVVDVLKPKAAVKQWAIGRGDLERRYVQRPLSFMSKMEWMSLVGEVLDKALSGENAMSLNSLLSGPRRGAQLSVEDFRDADTFVQALGKLMVYAPDFLTKSYCIWLNVPDYERDLAISIMKLPPEDGGLTDEDGMEIIEIFIDQNYEALENFFREKLQNLQKRVRARQKDASASRQSRR